MARARIRVEGGWRRSAGVFGGDDVGRQWLLRARWRDKTQQEMLADRAGASLRGRSVGRMAGQWRSCAVRRGRGSARNLARAPLNWASQGQRWGRCKVRRRAERVSLPAMEKKRRRRVFVVTICSPRPMRAVQRARLWAITCTASQAPLAGKRPEGRWFNPTPYLRSRMAFSISAWRRWSASSARVSPPGR